MNVTTKDNVGNQEEASACYVETKSLDGETNLKQKNVLPVLMGGKLVVFMLPRLFFIKIKYFFRRLNKFFLDNV